MSVASGYRLLDAFEATFHGVEYRHRRSNLGNRIAIELYEDLYVLGRSRKLAGRIEEKLCVINVIGDLTGVIARRADGTFGERNPSMPAVDEPGFAVARSHLATIEIGVEVKILFKGLIKQIGRVDNDLRDHVNQIKRAGGIPISVGIVGVNHADRCTSYEGDRSYPTTGSGGFLHPIQEAAEVEKRLEQYTKTHFDEFLILRFKATNEPPYPFEWVDWARTMLEYGAVLTRIARKYGTRF